MENYTSKTDKNMEEYEKLSKAVVAYADFLRSERECSYVETREHVMSCVRDTYNNAFVP